MAMHTPPDMLHVSEKQRIMVVKMLFHCKRGEEVTCELSCAGSALIADQRTWRWYEMDHVALPRASWKVECRSHSTITAMSTLIGKA